MNASTRNALRQLEQNRHAHDERHERGMQSARERWSVPTPARVYRVWQRAVSALVALTLFAGPLSVTFEQSRDAAGVLAAGSQRLDDDAWQQILDLAGLRVRFVMQEAQAAPIVDPTAPISFQPKITQSTGANGGVPVVNITAPNAAGISLNQYQSFNIDPVGLILNNSLMSGTSLTGGDVQANPNLSGRTASVIVNQVTSTGAAFASLLNGPLEVFGAPATVIIANPNGITTNGTGFTNTIGVTLSTGTPQFLSDLKGTVSDFNNAQAVGYSVTGGHIQIEGNAGVNGPGAGIEGTVGTIDLIGETIGINAPLYAGQRINAIAGRQFVLPSAVANSGTTYATSSNGAQNTASAINSANGRANNGLAIDATAFGAMTAGQIQVIGTAAGMGVRTDAQMAANTGDLLLSSNGDLTVNGSAAQQQATLQASGNLAMTGAHVGVTGYTINANGDVTSSGTIQTGGKLAVSAGGSVNVANAQSNGDAALKGGANVTLGDVQTGGALAVSAQGNDGAGDINLNGTSVVSGATNLQAARDINFNGQTNSGTLQATAQRNVNSSAALQTSGELALNATQGNVNAGGTVKSGSGLALASGQNVNVSGQVTAQNAVTVAAGQDLAVTGSLASGTTLAANVARDVSVAGSLLVGTDAQINAARNVDVPGVVIVQQDGVVNAQNNLTGSGSLAFGQNGTLTTGQDFAFTGKLLANGLQVSAGNNASVADVQAGGTFSIVANGLTSNPAGGGDVSFNGNAAVVGATNVQAARDVTVNGTLAGGSKVALTAQRNVTVATSGTVQAVGDLAVAAVNGSVSSSGTMNGAANLSVSGAQDVALTGATSVTGDTTLTAGHDIVIGGMLAGQGAATLDAGHDVSAGGSSGFVKDTSITAANDLSVTGSLQGAAVSLSAGQSVTLNNVQANNALRVTASGGTLAVKGLVASLSTASLSSGGDTSVSGALQSANALSVTSGGNTTVAGSVASNGDVTLKNANGSLVSTGNIQSGDNLLIDAAHSVDLGTQGTSALADLTVKAGQNLTMNGSVVAQGNGTLSAGGNIAGAAASAFGLAANVASGGDTNLTGSLRGGTVQTTAGGSASLHDLQAASGLALAANNDLNITGAVTGGAAVALNAGQNIGISGSIQSANDTTLGAQNGNVTSTGTIASNGAFNAQAGSDINLGGTTSAALDTTLTATRDINVTGMLAGQGQGSATAGRDIGGAGTMTFAQAATLAAGRDVAQGGLIQGQSVQVTAAGNIATNNVESASTVALTANGTNTANGPGNVTVNGSVAAAAAVSTTARNDVSVASTGKIASGTTVGIDAQHDINIAGAVESVGNTLLTAQQGSLNATGGINSGGKLDIATGLDLSLGASTSAVGDATLNAGRDALLNGLLIGEANGSVTAGHDIGGAGTQAFTQAVSFTAQHDIALTGGVQASEVSAIGGNNAALHDVHSSSTLTLSANGNAGGGDAAITGTATAPGVVTLSGARDVLVSGSLTTGDSLTLTALRDVSASGTLQTTAGDLTATTATGSIALTGTTTTSGALTLNSALDTRLGGQINAARDVTVQAGRDIALSGTLAGQLGGSLTASHDIAGAGAAAFAQAATLDASHDVALTGALQGASVTVTGGNNAGLGSVQAVTGNASVTANGNATGGDVTIGGAATALGALAVQAARDVSVGGAINTGSTTTIDATRNIALADVNSAGNLTFAATNGNASAVNVTTQGNLTGSAGQALTVSGATTVGGNAQLASGGNMTLTGGIGAQSIGTLTASASISAASVAFGQQATLSAGGSIGVSGAVATNGALNATAGNDLSLGSTQAGGALALQAQGHNGAGDVKVNGALASGSTATINAARDATIGGNASSTGTLAVSAGRNVTANGTIGANGDVTLTATSGNLAVGGAITSQGNLNANSGGALALNGELVNGNTTLAAGSTATLTGTFLGLGLANINVGGAVNGGGSLTFGKDITVGAGSGITLGAIQGAGQFTATSAGDMSLGATTAVGNVSAKSTGGSVSFGGDLQSGGNVTLQAANNATVAGAVSSMGTVNISGAQGNVSVAGVSSNGDTTMSAGQTLSLSGTSTVAGQFTLSGGNVTLSGSQGGSKNVSVSAQGTLDASGASVVSTQNMQFSGTNVTLGTAIAGGALTATASNQLSLVGAAVDAVGAATLSAGNGFYNASQVLSGGALYVSAPNLTNAANASLASTTTTTINATNFTNAGLVNGSTTNVTVAGALNNSGGSLMAVNSLNVNTGTLNNQNGIIFAGNPNGPGGPTTGDVSLTINGGDGSFYNAGGQLLAQRNMGISAMNMAFDPSQGTISQGGQLSITAGSISNSGTWNYGGQGVTLTGVYGINNYGTMTGTAPLTLSTNGTFTNFGQVTGSNVTFNGTLNNVAGAVMHADGTLALNGNTANRGTVEASGLLSVTGGNYDNQGATTQSKGDANFHLSGTLLNTGGSIFAGNNVNISAGAVVNDQTAPSAPVTTTATVTDPTLLWSAVAGTKTSWSLHHVGTGDGGELAAGSTTVSATLGDVLSPQGNASASSPVAGSGTVTFYDHDGTWTVADGPDPTATGSVTLSLPTISQTSVTQQPGTSGVISAGGSISLVAGSLSNQGGQIAAQGDVTLNVQSLSNGAAAATTTYQTGLSVDAGQFSSFFAQLKALGVITVAGTGNPTGTNCDSQGYCTVGDALPPTQFNIAPGAAPTATGSTTVSLPTGMIAAGSNLAIYGGNLANAGLLYAGNNVLVGAASLTNQGGNQQSSSTQTGCAAGVPSTACGTAGHLRGSNPTTTTFGYSQNDATIYAGHDLVIAAGQINNTFGNLLAGHDIVIGGVGTTASSTTPASSLNNTSGNIVAGNNITLNVSGAITNNLPPPVPVHENYGMKEQYSGCMTAGGYKESYCEGYVDQQSGSSSVISAGNNLQINAGSLTNIGSLIAAGNTATIAVAGPVVNEAQTLNAYWHSHWVQETGMFSSDKRHDVWACGSPAECTALYGSAYTSTGGTIDPPQPVGNIAATIQAPNLSITSSGQIENVGNVIGTSVTLTGQKLINGITTANTYTPRVNAPSQVISLSPVSLPGLNLSVPRAVGGALPTPVAGKASFVDNSLGTSALGNLGPQDLLTALPANLQPSSTLFYYNPQEEDLMLQQAALQQTGKASFIDGLTYDSKTNTSVTEQEKKYLYQNALDYAKANNLQLGEALTQTQINALDKPMLWYVEQTVPDPSCTVTGTATCPTITALMPQVYLPSDTSAMSAGGNISGQDVTLNFGKGSGGSILNTGSITASDTLTVNTDSLTNQANQVDIGQIWSKVKGGYVEETGTTVQPGGFMSAANMNLNVQTLSQIGGALQKLNADGTIDQAGTQIILAQIQQQLGSAFSQVAVSDNLHTQFVQEGGLGVFGQVLSIAIEIVASFYLGPLAGALIGSIAGQMITTGSVDWGSVGKAVAVAELTAGIDAGLGLNGASGFSDVGNGAVYADSSITLADVGQTAMNVAERSLVSAGVSTAIYGGSFGQALKNDLVSNVAAVGANFIGDEFNQSSGLFSNNSPLYYAAHAALGCASSAALGTGCAGGAIGGATSAVLSPWVISQIDPTGAPLDQGQIAAITALATLAGGGLAGLAGQNAMAGATTAQNEALNNATQHVGPSNGMLSKVCAATNPACSDQMIQTLNNAPAQNATMALGNMNAAAPYVAGALGVSLFGPETIAAAVTAGAYDYFGDLYSYRTGLQPDQPNFPKSYIAGVVGGLAYPFAIADEAISGMSKVGKIAANGYNAGVAGVGAFGSAAVTRQDNPDLSGGLGSGLAAAGTWAKATLPAPFGNIANQMLQGAAGPIQNVIQKALGH
ncbi:filamentous hemagglutinin N-terminal domain-containing protein [Paraburkholderia phenoliruptrix]|uniref:two-partner secretion domain-containing protein n=2 Tax=Pseudomonadota TaxID=1224 RepID=UPI001C4E4F5E|nr:filamentous hemagglutinin N-terminal domain-containing protein [Paraburkholderia phenoliruptrix]MBW0451058.1 filamentous hemagglutinin N-terminal domain-containing protein [Paraburkholderia phenoliruptrix]MBW9101913.1 filamentous hemagglutinin N-terminal domain-containing protein [Paraburkholderia phenoliruptrix]